MILSCTVSRYGNYVDDMYRLKSKRVSRKQNLESSSIGTSPNVLILVTKPIFTSVIEMTLPKNVMLEQQRCTLLRLYSSRQTVERVDVHLLVVKSE